MGLPKKNVLPTQSSKPLQTILDETDPKSSKTPFAKTKTKRYIDFPTVPEPRKNNIRHRTRSNLCRNHPQLGLSSIESLMEKLERLEE
jgi:hypothetical protein